MCAARLRSHGSAGISSRARRLRASGPTNGTLDHKVAALWRAARLGPTVERLRRHVLGGGSRSIEPGQFRALDAVAGHGPVTIRTLAEIMDVEPSTVTRAVVRLETDGLVFKRRAERDQREVLVELTDLGTARHQYFVDRAYRIYEEIFTVFDTSEREVLADLLERMLVSTDAALARPRCPRSLGG